MRIASVEIRGKAFIIDYAVLTVYLVIGAFIIDAAGFFEAQNSLEGLILATYLFLPSLYWFICEGLWSKTIGKHLMNLKVVKNNGSNCGLARSLVRNILRGVDHLPIIIFPIVGVIVAKLNDNNRRIGDIVAGTKVVEN